MANNNNKRNNSNKKRVARRPTPYPKVSKRTLYPRNNQFLASPSSIARERFKVIVPFTGAATAAPAGAIVFHLRPSNEYLRDTRVGTIAQVYQSYHFDSLKATYTHFAGANTSGNVVIYHSMDPTDSIAPAAKIQQACTDSGGLVAAVNCNSCYSVPNQRLKQSQQRSYVMERNFSKPDNSTSAQGVLLIGASSASSPANPGSIIIEGVISFFNKCSAEPFHGEGPDGLTISGAAVTPLKWNSFMDANNSHARLLGPLATVLEQSLPANNSALLPNDCANRRFSVHDGDTARIFALPPSTYINNWTWAALSDFLAGYYDPSQPADFTVSSSVTYDIGIPNSPTDSTLSTIGSCPIPRSRMAFAYEDASTSDIAIANFVNSLLLTFGSTGPSYFAIQPANSEFANFFQTTNNSTPESLSFLKPLLEYSAVITKCLTVPRIDLGPGYTAIFEPRPEQTPIQRYRSAQPLLVDPVTVRDNDAIRTKLTSPLDSQGSLAVHDQSVAQLQQTVIDLQNLILATSQSIDATTAATSTKVDDLDTIINSVYSPGTTSFTVSTVGTTDVNVVNDVVPVMPTETVPVQVTNGVAISNTVNVNLHDSDGTPYSSVNPLQVNDIGVLAEEEDDCFL